MGSKRRKPNISTMLKQIDEKTAEMLSDQRSSRTYLEIEQIKKENRKRIIKFSGESLEITFL